MRVNAKFWITDSGGGNFSDSDDDSQYRNENHETDLDSDSSEGGDVVMRDVGAQEVAASTWGNSEDT